MGWGAASLLLLGLAACAIAETPTPGPMPALEGDADFGPTYRVAAEMGALTTGAIVSLIDPGNGATIASGITSGDGQFRIDFPTRGEIGAGPFVLEVAKGLPSNSHYNAAGTRAVRLRTVVMKPSTGWRGIALGSTGRIRVSRATTALATVASLKNLAATVYPDLMLGLRVGQADTAGDPVTPDTFEPRGTGLTVQEFRAAFRIVDNAITLNQDPVEVMFRDGAGELRRADSGFLAAVAVPSTAKKGVSVQILGAHFPPSLAQIRVAFGDTWVRPTAVSSDGTMVWAPVPDLGATTRVVNIQVRVGGKVHPPIDFKYDGGTP